MELSNPAPTLFLKAFPKPVNPEEDPSDHSVGSQGQVAHGLSSLLAPTAVLQGPRQPGKQGHGLCQRVGPTCPKGPTH